MTINFSKYHGTGNDFVMIDNRDLFFKKNQTKLYQKLCERRFGVGSDGLILLQNHEVYDFEMIYFNADGSESSMCGNGGRCIVAFAHHLGIIKVGEVSQFMAIDGLHAAVIGESEEGEKSVALKMIDVASLHCYDGSKNDFILDTGSPHYVKFVDDLGQVDIFQEGSRIRQQADFAAAGINVNFVERLPEADTLAVATYERGVENETFSCGTGVVASSLASFVERPEAERGVVHLRTKGGELMVTFERKGEGFTNIWLKGGTKHVFDGTFKV